MEEMSRRSLLELEALMKKKLLAAGLPEAAANETAAHLTFADACGIHSHGAVRMDYYAECLVKGGITLEPNMSFEKTGAATGIFHGDNGMGHYVCNEAIAIAIHLAKEAGIAAVGIEQTSHSGTMAYYVKQAAEADLVAIAMCQSRLQHHEPIIRRWFLIWRQRFKRGAKFWTLARRNSRSPILGQ